MLSEISHLQKEKYFMISLSEVPRVVTFPETAGGACQRQGSYCLKSRVWVLQGEKRSVGGWVVVTVAPQGQCT